jgi:hypothetical protein
MLTTRCILILHALQILSFFPVMAMPLPGNCPLPLPPANEKLRMAMPAPTCALSELTVRNPSNLSVFVSPLFRFTLSTQRAHDGTLPFLTHWNILSAAPLQGAAACGDSFEGLSQILGIGAISCSAFERQSWGQQESFNGG